MISDVNLFGMSIDVALVTALVALAVLVPLRRALAAIGAYRWVWHPSLFNLSLFSVVWFALAVATNRFDGELANLIG